MKHLCIWLIRFYQKYLSPLKKNSCCRFYPSCSAYAIEAYRKRGFFAGSILAFWRIMRCNPVGGRGYDPVPDYGFSSKRDLVGEKNDRIYGSDRFVFRYDLPEKQSGKKTRKKEKQRGLKSK